ncbi:hypothetical protein LSCM1_04592 [Leishmania martiniquensis]|uniref:Protein kinase domain-containing protein n=1 Tax=Leishmania martiniquensis TaxID=1580590 RepID=A0A836HM57_9TRYP|nr:hypothetical protein LSCM1_04592 [Leishmania martiniquensis]
MGRGKAKIPNDGEVGPAFTPLSSKSEEEEATLSTNTASGLHCLKGTLRIELPTIASGQCTAPASPADCTNTHSPQTAIYPLSETALSGEMEERTPLTVVKDNAHRSAAALLQAGFLRESTGGSGGRGAGRERPSVIPASDCFEPVEMARKMSPMSLFKSIRRKRRCSSPTSGGALQREISVAAGRTNGLELGSARSSSKKVNSSGSPEPKPSVTAAFVPAVAATPAMPEQQQGSLPSTSKPASPISLADTKSVERSDTSDDGVEMDLVLRDASKIRGLRLTWLLYLLIVIVIVLFVLVLIQIVYETNWMLTRSATEAVHAEAASLLNNVNMQQYALEKLFQVMRDVDIKSFNPNSVTHNVVRDAICTSLYRAPIAFALYSVEGKQEWTTICKPYEPSNVPAIFPETVMPDAFSVRVVDYDKVVLSYRTLCRRDGLSETYMMMMDKETVGRTIMNNDRADYSTATLQFVMAAFFVPRWSTTNLTMLFRSLTEEAPSYTSTPNSPSASTLTGIFDSLCHTDSPYVWHTVLMPESGLKSGASSPGPDDWPATTTHPMPIPNFEYKRAWGQLSKANLCGVQCTSAKGDKCAFDNPTNVWFLVDHQPAHLDRTWTTVTIVGALSVMAVGTFSFIMLLVYISISVPVNYLRCQLMRAVGSNEVATHWQRKVVRWTHRLWLGDLTSIARSIYILSLCFRLNKKYVPDHVLRNHAKQLYVRRRKFNFLDEVDLKEDTALGEDTDSENEAKSPLPPFVGVSTAMPPSDTHFLWRFSIPHGTDEAAHITTDGEVEVSPAHAARRGTGLPCGAFSLGAYGEPDDMAMQEPPTMPVTATSIQSSSNIMNIRREYETTLLCIRIPSVELAYLIDYSGAVQQHRRLMRVLLHRIRRHRGALFHCSGDCLGAVWNAFEGCSNHAECAAVCAQEIANAFAPYRNDGLHVGMVLHQGTLVCGTVEYSKTAFVTAFGDGPREALAVAELAASVNTLNVLVTEPVKQALSGSYDCNIVDVIQLPNSAHPLLLFELSGSRMPERPLLNAPLQTTSRAQFSIGYARAFAQFRNHNFHEARQSVHELSAHMNSRNAHLLRRLERLCLFYSAQPAALPRPYHRAFPVWANYEAIAQAGLRDDPHLKTSQSENLMAHRTNKGVVYLEVPALRDDIDCIRDFKQELQANVRRLGSPRSTIRHRASPTIEESRTSTHHIPQSALPAQPALFRTCTNAGLLPEASGDLPERLSATASTKVRHLDPKDSVVAMSLPSRLPAPALTVHAHLTITEPPPVAVSAARVLARDEGEGGDKPERPGSATSSTYDVPALPRRFPVARGTTNIPPASLADTFHLANLSSALPQRAAVRSDSIYSSAQVDGASCSIIQSTHLSFQETGGLSSFSVKNEALPTAIKAKNGTTYLRSTRILGKGSFGCVYMGMDAHSGRLVAIKFLPLPSDESGMEVIESEVLILQRVNDTHVVQLLSYAFEGDTIVIFMECMMAGSLQNMISAFRTIPSATARVFMRDVLRGLSKLHSMGIIHRDMKPQNVLLSFAGNCKISDFGASAWLQELARKESKGEVCGTPVYLAPEAARGNPEKESDIWSCGIMFLQMITGRLPYTPEQLASGAAALVYQIGSGLAHPSVPGNLDVLDAEFVHACLNNDPGKRTSAAGLLQFALFTV